MKLGALLIAMALLAGCTTQNGRCYPIIGIGWVVVNTNQPVVFSSRAIGLNVSGNQTTLGLSSFTTVIVPTNSNVLIDLRK